MCDLNVPVTIKKCTNGVVGAHAMRGRKMERVESGEIIWLLDLDNKLFIDLPKDKERQKEWATWTPFDRVQFHLHGFRIWLIGGKTINVDIRP